LAEVKSGLVSPVGGKIVTVPETGETALVGFGSSVVRANKNAAVQAKLNLAAQKIAKAYAQDSLCGLIIGDKTTWSGEILDSYKSEHQEFVHLNAGDPLEGEGEELAKLEASRSEMMSTLRTSDAYSSARSGKLPPGVAVRTWFNDDKTWAYGMAVYVPSITNLAAGFRSDMQNAELLQQIQPRKEVGGSKPGSVKSVNNDSISRPSEKVKPLVSGRVGKDDL